ncbi:hypothetical protein CsSME_00034642 [Camellia sinensis var. sinensis]
MPEISPEVTSHRLNVDKLAKAVTQRARRPPLIHVSFCVCPVYRPTICLMNQLYCLRVCESTVTRHVARLNDDRLEFYFAGQPLCLSRRYQNKSNGHVL